MQNYAEVVHQMEAFGVEFRAKDLPLAIDFPRRKGCGLKGKWWYWLRTFQTDNSGSFIVGRFGSYKSGDSEKVEIDWQPMAEAERLRAEAERRAAQEAQAAARLQEAELAALGAADLWARASRTGHSPYLERKGVVGEACRYLPNGALLIPLLRYDRPREDALRAVQTINADGSKFFTKGFAKAGCALRLGTVAEACLVLICEGYATGLTLRMASNQTLAVYVALDAGNLQWVVPLVRELHPQSRILICADDDYLTRDQVTKRLNNPGRTAAKRAAEQTNDVDVVYPIFNATTRGPKDTDYNDLHARQGLEAVRRQLRTVVWGMERIYG